ncbi:MAG TPA: DNA mismatch repair endonuclease MutL [Candidatus Onthoplasma faecigallinarum]|nr:DNA mismatch repair endonuclease MutL [Candidatus Onthoplasma faecigallinarum]
MAINILDSMIINRISAGEVVESPFSIVKELIDNALDANATKITVEIKNGGIDSIVVKDNGKGIEFDDIKKAFLPHATSKIKNLDDLDAIYTLGFRGEALASISNVSQTNMVSKTPDADCAYTIDVNGGVFSEILPTSADVGTKIEVNNLFYNTPARRKFLKRPKTEEAQITNIMARYILAHPDIEFKYTADNKTIYKTTGKTLLDAIYCVYGEETTRNIMSIDKTVGNLKLTGYVSKIGYSKPNTTYQTLIINGRYVIDEIVSKAAYMAFEEYLMTRQFPFYVLNLTMPNVDVDVNVHPSKMNVKFASPSKIYDLVYTAIRGAIYEFLNPNKNTPVDIKSIETPQDNLIKTDINSLKEIEIQPSIKPINTNKVELRQTSFSPITFFDLKKETESATTLVNNINFNRSTEQQNNDIAGNMSNLTSNLNLDEDSDQNKSYKNIDEFIDYKIVGELFNEFLILEKNDNMILVDFHAGHERLNYDKFTKMVESRDVVIQDLLIPYVQELTEPEVEFILDLKPALSELGFDVDAFGDKKIIINSVPMQLKDINLKDFIDDLVHDMKNLKPNMNNEIRHYLMQKACKSSVKSGMKLNEMEIKELLKNLDINNPVLLCPHGRPVVTIITRAQIEKWFKRIV